MKIRFLLTGALVLAACAANAAFTITLDDPSQSIALPGAPTDLIFTGTITKDEMGDGNASTTIFFPGLSGDVDFLSGSVNSSAFFTWTQTSDPTFTGEIFRITVNPTSQLGLHDSNSFSPDGNASIRFTYRGVTGASYDSGVVDYSVNVTAVPEPATMSILALGGLALLRRRKKA